MSIGHEDPGAQKKRRGLARVAHAAAYSWAGLKVAWHEPAFRQEALLAMVLLPAAFWLGSGWIERSLLVASVALVLIIELLNTGIEAVVDRVGPEWHEQSKRAKDLGSAAVLIGLVLCGFIWISAIVARLLEGA